MQLRITKRAGYEMDDVLDASPERGGNSLWGRLTSWASKPTPLSEPALGAGNPCHLDYHFYSCHLLFLGAELAAIRPSAVKAIYQIVCLGMLHLLTTYFPGPCHEVLLLLLRTACTLSFTHCFQSLKIPLLDCTPVDMDFTDSWSSKTRLQSCQACLLRSD